MRYVVKWNNGGWKIFDTLNYCDVSLEYLRRVADERCAFHNVPAPPRRRA